MDFEWDDEKNWTNKLKHRITFESAIEVFLDPFEQTEFDQFIDDEERWKTVGMIANWSVLVVIYVERPRGSDTVTRIISARKANKDETKRYERNRRQNS